jgi:malate synthase
MEDAATAEICRAQVWQWLHHGVPLLEGGSITADLVLRLIDEEAASDAVPDDARRTATSAALDLLRRLTLDEQLVDFFTSSAQEELP